MTFFPPTNVFSSKFARNTTTKMKTTRTTRTVAEPYPLALLNQMQKRAESEKDERVKFSLYHELMNKCMEMGREAVWKGNVNDLGDSLLRLSSTYGSMGERYLAFEKDKEKRASFHCDMAQALHSCGLLDASIMYLERAISLKPEAEEQYRRRMESHAKWEKGEIKSE